MNLKSALITCIIVVLYLSICSWRFESLNKEDESVNSSLVINVK